MFDVPMWLWYATVGGVLALFVLDFLVAARKPHEVGLKEATIESVAYVGIALLFGLVVWSVLGGDAATQYYAGWLVEKSLSVDNLFVFVIIFAQFGVPKENQQKTLLFGIAAALVMRGDLHRHRGRRDRPVLLGVRHLRPVPAVHGGAAGAPPRRGPGPARTTAC